MSQNLSKYQNYKAYSTRKPCWKPYYGQNLGFSFEVDQ